jgi:alpha-mannosidase
MRLPTPCGKPEISNTHERTRRNADCAFVKLGRSTSAELDTATAQLNVLAGGQVDGPALGIPGQHGATLFLQRFALRGHGAYDPVAAMKFALEQQNPFVAGEVIGEKVTAPLPPDTFSLLTVSNPNVLLWALKPAEEGIARGLIARLWNVSDAPATATIALASGLSSAQHTTHIETDLEPVPLTTARSLDATFARQQLQTFRLLR